MTIQNLLEQDPNRFLKLIRRRAGNARFFRDEDLTQVFWIGVLKSVPKARPDDPVKYLVNMGYGEVRNHRAAVHRREYVKTCPSCSGQYPYRTMYCVRCMEELEFMRRKVPEKEIPYYDEDPVLGVAIQQFIDTLQGKERYIAHRWLVDRADLHFKNHLKSIAGELGISAPRVAQLKTKIRRKFKEWL